MSGNHHISVFSNGEVPQDLKFNGEKTSLIIGKRNKIREHVTINTGTEGGGGLTLIGNDCLFMTGSHVAHDVQISNGVIIAIAELLLVIVL